MKMPSMAVFRPRSNVRSMRIELRLGDGVIGGSSGVEFDGLPSCIYMRYCLFVS